MIGLLNTNQRINESAHFLMPLKTGDQAPDFTLPSTRGSDFSLRIHATGKPLILYFYPKDFTSVCTKEACEFRDAFSFFRELDVAIIGISSDNVETHRRFKAVHALPFELLADEQGKVASLYKAIIPVLRVTRRVTYLLDQEQTVAAVYENLFAADKHVRTMIEKLKAGSHQ
jgi:peroxiredoxin Q/BCP